MADGSGNTEELIVVKRPRVVVGHHGGAWKVAYADFVTALMAFFLVMWIVGLSNPIKQAIAAYFKDPAGFKKEMAGGNALFAVKTAKTFPTDSGKGKGGSQELERLKAAKATIEKMVSACPEFKKLRGHIDVKMVDEGLRIDLVESQQSMFFDSASAKIKPQTRALLKKIASELAVLPNRVILEGHTDARPLARGDGYTNWELSADRANQARQVMEGAGLADSKIAQVRGYADTQPRNPADPNSYTNRRVSIVVVLNNVLQRENLSASGFQGTSAVK